MEEENTPIKTFFMFWYLKILITSQEENSSCKCDAMQVIKVICPGAYSHQTGAGSEKGTTLRKSSHVSGLVKPSFKSKHSGI